MRCRAQVVVRQRFELADPVVLGRIPPVPALGRQVGEPIVTAVGAVEAGPRRRLVEEPLDVVIRHLVDRHEAMLTSAAVRPSASCSHVAA